MGILGDINSKYYKEMLEKSSISKYEDRIKDIFPIMVDAYASNLGYSSEEKNALYDNIAKIVDGYDYDTLEQYYTKGLQPNRHSNEINQIGSEDLWAVVVANALIEKFKLSHSDYKDWVGRQNKGFYENLVNLIGEISHNQFEKEISEAERIKAESVTQIHILSYSDKDTGLTLLGKPIEVNHPVVNAIKFDNIINSARDEAKHYFLNEYKKSCTTPEQHIYELEHLLIESASLGYKKIRRYLQFEKLMDLPELDKLEADFQKSIKGDAHQIYGNLRETNNEMAEIYGDQLAEYGQKYIDIKDSEIIGGGFGIAGGLAGMATAGVMNAVKDSYADNRIRNLAKRAKREMADFQKELWMSDATINDVYLYFIDNAINNAEQIFRDKIGLTNILNEQYMKKSEDEWQSVLYMPIETKDENYDEKIINIFMGYTFYNGSFSYLDFLVKDVRNELASIQESLGTQFSYDIPVDVKNKCRDAFQKISSESNWFSKGDLLQLQKKIKKRGVIEYHLLQNDYDKLLEFTDNLLSHVCNNKFLNITKDMINSLVGIEDIGQIFILRKVEHIQKAISSKFEGLKEREDKDEYFIGYLYNNTAKLFLISTKAFYIVDISDFDGNIENASGKVQERFDVKDVRQISYLFKEGIYLTTNCDRHCIIEGSISKDNSGKVRTFCNLLGEFVANNPLLIEENLKNVINNTDINDLELTYLEKQIQNAYDIRSVVNGRKVGLSENGIKAFKCKWSYEITQQVDEKVYKLIESGILGLEYVIYSDASTCMITDKAFYLFDSRRRYEYSAKDLDIARMIEWTSNRKSRSDRLMIKYEEELKYQEYGKNLDEICFALSVALTYKGELENRKRNFIYCNKCKTLTYINDVGSTKKCPKCRAGNFWNGWKRFDEYTEGDINDCANRGKSNTSGRMSSNFKYDAKKLMSIADGMRIKKPQEEVVNENFKEKVTMYCPFCGKQIKRAAKFCNFCGKQNNYVEGLG